MKNSNLTVRYDISAKYLSVVIIIPMEPEDVHPYFADGVAKVAEGKDKLSTLKAARLGEHHVQEVILILNTYK